MAKGFLNPYDVCEHKHSAKRACLSGKNVFKMAAKIVKVEKKIIYWQ